MMRELSPEWGGNHRIQQTRRRLLFLEKRGNGACLTSGPAARAASNKGNAEIENRKATPTQSWGHGEPEGNQTVSRKTTTTIIIKGDGICSQEKHSFSREVVVLYEIVKGDLPAGGKPGTI